MIGLFLSFILISLLDQEYLIESPSGSNDLVASIITFVLLVLGSESWGIFKLIVLALILLIESFKIKLSKILFNSF